MDFKKIISLFIFYIFTLRAQELHTLNIDRDNLIKELKNRYKFTVNQRDSLSRRSFINDSLFIRDNGARLLNALQREYFVSDYFKLSEIKLYAIPVLDQENFIIGYIAVLENQGNVLSSFDTEGGVLPLVIESLKDITLTGGDTIVYKLLSFGIYKKYFTFIKNNYVFILKEKQVYKMIPKFKKNKVIKYFLEKSKMNISFENRNNFIH